MQRALFDKQKLWRYALWKRERERENNVEFIFLDHLKCHYHLGTKDKVQVKVAEEILCDLLNWSSCYYNDCLVSNRDLSTVVWWWET